MDDNSFDSFDFNGVINVRTKYTPKHIIAGDTDSAYIDLGAVFDKDAAKDEVIEFSDNIGSEANDAFPQFMSEIFNVDAERVKAINTDREAVADKAIFLGKKMYVMHLVNMEGLDCDKLKKAGVAIIKSDTPKVIQAFLTELVELLLDKAPYEEVEVFVDIFKEKYHAMSLMEVGNPKSVKALKKYEVKFKDDGHMKSYPQHVKAALHYNHECTMSDIKIVSGDKVRIIYINHKKYSVMALPVDVEVLPEFTNELIINWKKQWTTVQKKIDIFLKPIGYDRKSRQKQLVNDLIIKRDVVAPQKKSNKELKAARKMKDEAHNEKQKDLLSSLLNY